MVDLRSTNFFSNTEFLNTNFHVLEKSEHDIENCQIFFLGNTHDTQDQHWKISGLIQQLYQEGDVVLVESFYNSPTTCAEVKFVSKKIDIKGWDSNLRQKEFDQTENLIQVLLHVDLVRRNGLAHKDWIEDIHRLIRMFPPPADKHEEIIREIYSAQQLVGLHTPESRIHCFNGVIFSLAKIWLSYLQRELIDDLVERNQCMIRTIDRHLPKASRIFVIAGIAHLTLDPQFNHVEGTTDSVQLIHQYCKTKKYVILYPNKNDVQLCQIKKELNPSLVSLFKKIFIRSDFYTIAKIVSIGTILCLGFASVSLPFLIHRKVMSFFSTRDVYKESLKKLSISNLLLLISFAAENPQSLPRQSGIKPLETMTNE